MKKSYQNLLTRTSSLTSTFRLALRRLALRRLALCGPALLLAGALGGGVPVAYAGGFAIPDAGGRKTGMEAVVGRPDELSAVFHNPAGLALQPGTRLYLASGLAFIRTNIRIRPWGCDATSCESSRFITHPVDGAGFYPEAEPTRSFGAIPFFVASTSFFSDRLVAALSLYVPDAIGAGFAADGPQRYHLIDSLLVAGFSSFSLAYRINRYVQVGAGVSVLYVHVDGSRKFYPMVDNATTGQRDDFSGLIGDNAELQIDGSDVVPGWNFGLLVWPHRTLSIGLAVIGRADATLQGDVKVVGDPDKGLFKGKTLSGTHRTDLVIPWSFAAGVNWDINRWVEVGTEFRYWVYSDLQEQRIKVDGLQVVKEILSPKDYSDSWQISGGVKVRLPMLPALELMAGAHYDTSPAPNRTLSLEQPMLDNAGFHLGLRYQLGRFRLGLTYGRYFYLKRSIDDSVTAPPTNADAVGNGDVVTFSFETHLARGVGAAPSNAPSY